MTPRAKDMSIESLAFETSQFQRTEVGDQPAGQVISVEILEAKPKAWLVTDPAAIDQTVTS